MKTGCKEALHQGMKTGCKEAKLSEQNLKELTSSNHVFAGNWRHKPCIESASHHRRAF